PRISSVNAKHQWLAAVGSVLFNRAGPGGHRESMSTGRRPGRRPRAQVPGRSCRYWRPRDPTVSTEAFVDYYELLQLSPHADDDTIHRVFRHLAKRHHPDAQAGGDPERFKRLLDAYKVLSDPALRATYDARTAITGSRRGRSPARRRRRT